MGFVRYYRDAKGKAYYLKHCKDQSHAFRKHAHEEYSVALVTGGEKSAGKWYKYYRSSSGSRFL